MDDQDDKDRVSLEPLSGEDALRALLKVDPESEPSRQDADAGKPKLDKKPRAADK